MSEITNSKLPKIIKCWNSKNIKHHVLKENSKALDEGTKFHNKLLKNWSQNENVVEDPEGSSNTSTEGRETNE